MEIKYTFQGLLIYSTIAAYVLAFVLTIARRKKAGQLLFALGFCIAVVGYIYRWVDVRHVPLQNLFEVFLFLGAACYPISWFCKKLLRDARKGWGDLTRILLVGGSTRMPMVQRALEEQSGMKVDRSLSPDEAVAHGAALYAGLLQQGSKATDRNLAVKNVNSHDLGVLGLEKETGNKSGCSCNSQKKIG